MNENAGRILELYDELASFPTQVNLYIGRALTDTHELAIP